MLLDEPTNVEGSAATVTPIDRARQKRKAPRTSELTELEMSEQLVEKFGGELRYCAAFGGWHRWTGTHWESDEVEHARECVKVIARELAGEAVALLDRDKFNAAKRAGSARGVAAILDLARSAPDIVFSSAQADRDPWLLNVQNGTLDLRNGLLRPHAKADLITKACPVAYDPQAMAPTFERFLREVQPDPEVRAYLGRLFGYSAIGIVREHVIAVLWGPGANGKSVLADAVTFVFGGYAKPGPSSLIVSSGYDPHPCDTASLVSSRLVVVHETKRGASFDASKIKLLTGGDKLTARRMRQDYFTFEPTHTLVMLSNYRPSADATDAALWRRVQLVPFDVTIPEEDRDPNLSHALRAEGPGILRWLVDGALEYQCMGLAPPAIVREQTEKYRAAEDTIGAFLEERTVKLSRASVKAGLLYKSFTQWCDDNGRKACNGNDFGAELKGRGFDKVKHASGYVYPGLGLHAAEHEEGER